MTTGQHRVRINQELTQAGITPYGLKKSESRYLPKVIHDDEHIGGVVYGRYNNGSAMLIATDKRIIFLDKKPLFVTNEELSYFVVSGVRIDLRGVISSITLHTKAGDYVLRYVNRTCATNFKKYLEEHHLEKNTTGIPAAKPADSEEAIAKPFPFINDDALRFLQKHDVGVLSTVNRQGDVHGAVIYYVMDELHRLYILTKAETTKARNVVNHEQVALTIFDADSGETTQIQGRAQIETEEKIKRHVFNKIMKPRKFSGDYHLPPIAWVEAGMFVIIRITPEAISYADFSQKGKKA